MDNYDRNKRKVKELGIFGQKATNQFRKQMQMRLLKTKERECLRCSFVFSSSGPENRLCHNCRRGEAQYSPGEINGVRI